MGDDTDAVEASTRDMRLADFNSALNPLHGADGVQRRVVQPLIERVFRKAPDLAHLDGRDFSAARLAIDRIRHHAQILRHFFNPHHFLHGASPLSIPSRQQRPARETKTTRMLELATRESVEAESKVTV